MYPNGKLLLAIFEVFQRPSKNRYEGGMSWLRRSGVEVQIQSIGWRSEVGAKAEVEGVIEVRLSGDARPADGA